MSTAANGCPPSLACSALSISTASLPLPATCAQATITLKAPRRVA